MAGKKPSSPKGDYAVGKGRTPVHTRFAKGQSGNPGGKKRGPHGLREILKAIAESEIVITRDGRRTTVEMQHALLLSRFEAALKGSSRAAEDLLDRIERLVLDHGPKQKAELPEEDRALLDRALRGRSLLSRPKPDDREAEHHPTTNKPSADEDDALV